MKRLQEIETRKLEIRNLLQSDADINLDDVAAELEQLETEKNTIEQRNAIAKSIQAGAINVTHIEKPEQEERGVPKMDREQILASTEYRTAFYKQLQNKPLNEVEQRALTTGAGSAGAAVPTTTLNQIIDKLQQTSALYNFITVSFVPGNLSLVVANAKNAAAWKAQGEDGTPADDTVASVTLAGYEIIKLVEISEAAYSMSIDQLETYLTSEIGRQFSIAIEKAIIDGDGVGEPTGVIPGITWVNNTNSTTFTTQIGFDDLMDTIALLPTMYHQNAIFVVNRKTLFGGIRKVKTNDGLPIFNPNASERAQMTILGYPIVLDDYAPDDTVLFGDFSYYYMNFSKAPTIETSREAGFKSGKTIFRGLAVADGKPALSEAFVRLVKSV